MPIRWRGELRKRRRRLKSKRSLGSRIPGPSLAALARVNVISLAVGFPLLTLGLITGMFWQHSVSGVFWTGSPHETWMLVAWAIYVGLVSTRFVWHQAGMHHMLLKVQDSTSQALQFKE